MGYVSLPEGNIPLNIPQKFGQDTIGKSFCWSFSLILQTSTFQKPFKKSKSSRRFGDSFEDRFFGLGWVAPPPSKQWQMKVYRDPLLKIRITIRVLTGILGGGDNPRFG